MEELAKEYSLAVLAHLPLDHNVAEMMDNGQADRVDTAALDSAIDLLIAQNEE